MAVFDRPAALAGAKRLVNTNPIVPDGVDRDHMRVVLEFLGKRICEALEAPIEHPQAAETAASTSWWATSVGNKSSRLP